MNALDLTCRLRATNDALNLYKSALRDPESEHRSDSLRCDLHIRLPQQIPVDLESVSTILVPVLIHVVETVISKARLWRVLRTILRASNDPDRYSLKCVHRQRQNATR